MRCSGSRAAAAQPDQVPQSLHIVKSRLGVRSASEFEHHACPKGCCACDDLARAEREHHAEDSCPKSQTKSLNLPAAWRDTHASTGDPRPVMHVAHAPCATAETLYWSVTSTFQDWPPILTNKLACGRHGTWGGGELGLKASCRAAWICFRPRRGGSCACCAGRPCSTATS